LGSISAARRSTICARSLRIRAARVLALEDELQARSDGDAFRERITPGMGALIARRLKAKAEEESPS
jgi:hypothetical protein